MAVLATTTPKLHLHDCTYTSCYCEENVYLLLKQLLQQHDRPASQLFAVFISNPHETVPFWYQRASQHQDGFVVWDYHVIALEVCPQSGALVWDLDLVHPTLQFPCTFLQYAQHVLQADSIQLPQQYQRLFRLVPASSLLRHFASDRSHMRRQDGTWCAEPPAYPSITAADGTTMNLRRYRDMTLDVLLDRVPAGQPLPRQRRGPGAAAAAAAAAAGGAQVGLPAAAAVAAAAAGTVAHLPCRPAAGLLGNNGTTAGAPSSGCTGGSSSELSPSVAAVGPGDYAHAGAAQPQVQQCNSNSTSAHRKAAGQSLSGSNQHTATDRLVTWEDVVAAASVGKYGVVLHENTLLRCLMGSSAS